MMTHAYERFYLADAARTLGNMLHAAVVNHGMEGHDVLNRFIATGLAAAYECGNPRVIAGRSGCELLMDLLERSTGTVIEVEAVPTYSRSAVYWAGWLLAHYQWHSGRTFRTILDAVPYEDLLGLYEPMHEADIEKCCDVLDSRLNRSESPLKRIRTMCGLTQQALAAESGVSLNTIRAYERKSKDLARAQSDIVMRLARALMCGMEELVGN